MQDGDSIKRKDEAKRETIEQAHLLRATRQHVFLVSNSYARIYNHSNNTSKEQCRATTEYNAIIYSTRHLSNSTLQDWRHTHTFTQNPKEMEVATSLSVESFLSDHNSEPLRRGPRAPAWRVARVVRSTARTGFWENGRGFRRYLRARSRDPGLAQGSKGRRRRNSPGTRIRQEQNPTTNQPTNPPRPPLL